MPQPRVDYGLDAPGVVRNFLLIGIALLLPGLLGRIVPPRIGETFRAIAPAGAYLVLIAALMVVTSRWGKLRARDNLLRRICLTGGERVLDVGCGHGLLLLGAARLLPHGRAVGIDCWSQVDQAGNSRDATMANAALAGVAERIELLDGDMRAMPLADASFDAVIACLSIHNIPDAAGRDRAIEEIARVLKPGGHVALLDYTCTRAYARRLKGLGWAGVVRAHPSPWMFPPCRTVVAHKPA